MSEGQARTPNLGKVYLNGVEIGSLCGPFIMTPSEGGPVRIECLLRGQRQMLDDVFGDTDPRLPEFP